MKNESGNSWVEWCVANDYCIMNTWFKNHSRRLWTWRSTGSEVKNQIDFIAVCNRYRSSISDCKTYPGTDCSSDHVPVVAIVKARVKNEKRVKT